jgi:toxin-antitoxin system PIN domain toxin
VAYFCRTTQQGFLRLSTNRKAFGSRTLTPVEAWQKYEIFLSDSLVSYFDEPADVETHWRRFTQNATTSSGDWTDSYLAAFALAGNLELISFDRSLANYPGVRCSVLS